jgi:hypothetical protein
MRINMAGLLRADTLTRYQAHKIAYDAEFLTTDEIRELEDRPPMAAQVAIEADNARRGLRVVNSAGGGPQ